MKWSVSEAKARFSELLAEAVRDGPQTVTRHGETLALVVSPEQFTPQPEPGAFWRLPNVYQPGLTLSDADIDALFLADAAPTARTPPPEPAPPAAPSPAPLGPAAESAAADPAGTGPRALAGA